MDRQMTLAEMNDEFGATRTNKKDFLEKMDRIIPWDSFIKLERVHIKRASKIIANMMTDRKMESSLS